MHVYVGVRVMDIHCRTGRWHPPPALVNERYHCMTALILMLPTVLHSNVAL